MTNIPAYIEAIIHGDYATAYRINRMDNVFPGVLGRVCHRPCEPACRHGRPGLGEPVQICFLKRSASDFGQTKLGLKINPNGKTVCVIGAGPSGLTAANDLAIRGYNVTVLEQFEKPGGMMRYGIPSFRLPEHILDLDIESITNLGVQIKCGERIDSWTALEQLNEKVDAVILAGGCMLPSRFNMPGLDAEGVLWGLDFMMDANRESLNIKPKSVIVIGGGFTALDCARTSYRLGVKDITIAYRRTMEYMQFSGEEELHALKEEGIELKLQISPVAIETENNQVTGVKFIKNEIGANRKMTAIEGSEFVQPCDAIIFAIGQSTEDLEGFDTINMEPSPEISDAIFVAGDFRNGSGTVIEACADGRKVARKVHEKLFNISVEEIVEITEIDIDDMPRERKHDFVGPEKMDVLPLEERTQEAEVELGLTDPKTITEAHRCYLCHYNFQIDIDRCIYCMKCIDVMPVDCIKLAKDVTVAEDGTLQYEETKSWQEMEAITIDNDACIRCGNCLRACPVDCITLSKYELKTFEIPAEESVSK